MYHFCNIYCLLIILVFCRQVQWKNWHRKDGTSTTWEKEIVGDNDILERWDREQMKIRESLARKSLDVDIEKISQAAAHEIRAMEWRDAVWEKFTIAEEEMKKKKGLKFDWDEELSRHKTKINEQIEQTKRQRELLLMRSKGGRASTIAMAHSKARERAQAQRLSDNEQVHEVSIDDDDDDNDDDDDDDDEEEEEEEEDIDRHRPTKKSRGISFGHTTGADRNLYPDFVDDGGTDELDGWSNVNEEIFSTTTFKQEEDEFEMEYTDTGAIRR